MKSEDDIISLKEGDFMVLSEDSTAFDVLAYLCALLDKEDERECAIQWSAAAPRHIKNALNKYKEFLDIILKSSLNEYRFTKAI